MQICQKVIHLLTNRILLLYETDDGSRVVGVTEIFRYTGIVLDT